MLSEVSPVPPLLLKDTLALMTDGHPIRDDVFLIFRLIQEIETRLARTVRRPSAVLNEVIVSFVFIAETCLTRFFFINRIVGVRCRA